ncbi:MAG TPA: FimV/HubP family polar landmark protein, partial [Gallionellaceae bacterium]|nr:FimV/HubP family polar landmark protein [Gallionellaceae bacterium]
PVAASVVKKSASAAKLAEPEEIDAISEADLFLNFGRDVQAEEVLKEALSKKPSNVPVQLKLLTIYANRKDVNAFSSIARQIKDSGDTMAWEQAAALGRAVDSSNPMYGGTGGELAAAKDILSEPGKPSAMPALDLDIGFNIPMDLDVTSATHAADASVHAMDFDVSGHAASSMDLDVTGSHANVTETLLPDFDVTGSHPNVTGTEHMDFDVTGSRPNVTGAEYMDFDVTGSHPNVTGTHHMDFDVTASHPGVVASVAPEDNMGTVVLSAPMDIDISSSPPATSPAAGMASSGLGGMDFDISSSPPATSPAAGVASSGLGGMDFDISSSPPAQGAKAEPAMDIGLGSISLNLDEAETVVFPVAEAKKDERWQEVATKLDLARAYQEMGDADGAREILGEVLNEGDVQQIEAARTLMLQL